MHRPFKLGKFGDRYWHIAENFFIQFPSFQQWSAQDFTMGYKFTKFCRTWCRRSHHYKGCRTPLLAWSSSSAHASMSLPAFFSCTGFRSAGESSSSCAVLWCTPSFTGGVRTTYPTSWGPSTTVVHAPAYDLLQQRTSQCRSYGQNVESAPFLTLALPRRTLYQKTCVLFLTLRFLGSDWRLTFLVLLLTFVDYCLLLMTLVMHLCSACNRRTINFYVMMMIIIYQ